MNLCVRIIFATLFLLSFSSYSIENTQVTRGRASVTNVLSWKAAEFCKACGESCGKGQMQACDGRKKECVCKKSGPDVKISPPKRKIR